MKNNQDLQGSFAQVGHKKRCFSLELVKACKAKKNINYGYETSFLMLRRGTLAGIR